MNEDRNTVEKYSVLSQMELSQHEQTEIWGNVLQQITEGSPAKKRKHRSNAWGTSLAATAAVLVVVGGIYSVSNHGFGPTHTKIVANDNGHVVVPIAFFQNLSASGVKLRLAPDLVVRHQMPNVSPPTTTVFVYLPVYPGATPAKPVTSIGDMGTPMDGDLVDGTVYFKSKDSQAQIKTWYTQQFQKLGYSILGQGSLQEHGKTISSYFGFAKHVGLGNLTRDPDIDLGFLGSKQGGETIFKLKASYIITPPRPKDAYLPTNIVKVVLTEGNTTKTVTDTHWIASVVQMVNTLQVSTPSVNPGGPAADSGTPTVIDADFYDSNNSAIHVTYSMLTATIVVGKSNVALNVGPSPTLAKDLSAVFGN